MLLYFGPDGNKILIIYALNFQKYIVYKAHCHCVSRYSDAVNTTYKNVNVISRILPEATTI